LRTRDRLKHSFRRRINGKVVKYVALHWIGPSSSVTKTSAMMLMR
jgi:hypothetical protein